MHLFLSDLEATFLHDAMRSRATQSKHPDDKKVYKRLLERMSIQKPLLDAEETSLQDIIERTTDKITVCVGDPSTESDPASACLVSFRRAEAISNVVRAAVELVVERERADAEDAMGIALHTQESEMEARYAGVIADLNTTIEQQKKELAQRPLFFST